MPSSCASAAQGAERFAQPARTPLTGASVSPIRQWHVQVRHTGGRTVASGNAHARVIVACCHRADRGIRLGQTTAMSRPVESSSAFNPLVQQIVDRMDRDNNGQISRAELGDFLTALVAQFREVCDRPHTALSAAASAGPASTDTIGDEFPPSMWTDNNAPYGVTFAGFSPQLHRDLTLDDLGVPGKAEKYAVYHYLVTNRVEPTSDWAPAAADALNRRYNTTVYRAIDGETLGYGNEYVHSAPNGYGMLPGTYNPNARGEFFWGARDV